jgi:wyosine [tRNA(Phe)-imidazoG37] synthetase (radical SAM superfamily)
LEIARQAYYEPGSVFRDVSAKLDVLRNAGQRVDYLAFVPDGDPTLDVNLGDIIDRVKTLAVPVGVLTNASLSGHARVRDHLAKADLVSLKVDAVQPKVWRRINRPHAALRLDRILEGIIEFAHVFSGIRLTETLLVRGLNDSEESLKKIAEFLSGLKPKTAYLSIPTRPPTENWVKAPHTKRLNLAYQIFVERGLPTEFLIGYEGDAFNATGDVKENILSITAVHPMRKSALAALLSKTGAPWALVDQLIANGELMETEYDNHHFYLRRISHEE